ncbi:MAG TPA: hypothetical protein VGN60_08995 [Devosia sp.]|jgi:hypothetical protein|nr:hypothetical protein [Devosia sp.]
MSERDLVVTISGSVTRDPTSRPVTVSWRVTAGPHETAEEIGKAITEACRQLNSALKEAVK